MVPYQGEVLDALERNKRYKYAVDRFGFDKSQQALRVEPQITTPSPAPIAVGNTLAFAFNVETVQTTVLASDGETIVLGGLISKQDNRTENGIPFFKDIPYVGSLFRFRSRLLRYSSRISPW